MLPWVILFKVSNERTCHVTRLLRKIESFSGIQITVSFTCYCFTYPLSTFPPIRYLPKKSTNNVVDTVLTSNVGRRFHALTWLWTLSHLENRVKCIVWRRHFDTVSIHGEYCSTFRSFVVVIPKRLKFLKSRNFWKINPDFSKHDSQAFGVQWSFTGLHLANCPI